MTRSKSISCDVAVIGAGAAGIAAAVAAAETGVEVVSIERYGFTGGLATAAMVGTICGLFYRSLTTRRYAVQGFAREFAEAVQAQSRSQAASFAEGLHFLPYCPNAFHQQAVRRLQTAGAKLYLRCLLTGAKAGLQRIQCLHVQCADQSFVIRPQAVVDCTGNAQVSALLRLERIEQTDYQAGAFVFRICGLPVMAQDVLALNLIRWLKKAVQSGQLPEACERLSVVPGTVGNGMALLKLGLPGLFHNTPECVTRYELEARANCAAIVDYLSRSEPLLANMTIAATASEVGLRSGPRAQGLEVLTEEQVLACSKPKDGVAVGAWPMEYWGAERTPRMRYFQQDDGYWISAGMLVSRHLDNLFFAGRGLSATEAAMASARVIGTCLSSGYAAGRLAAANAQTGSWRIAIESIQNRQMIGAD